ncbi:hypothetical protein B0H10DRAFT_1937981 [Mycena sp. CBHHK59/15]|nr:hypothetical protein B0H10DRAFT_1937981 [Mycena sp. CBHHK59/15]
MNPIKSLITREKGSDSSKTPMAPQPLPGHKCTVDEVSASTIDILARREAAEKGIEILNASLKEESELLAQHISELQGQVLAAKGILRNTEERKAWGLREIAEKEAVVGGILADIEPFVGGEQAMIEWLKSLGEDEKTKPAWPDNLQGKSKALLKLHIGTPQLMEGRNGDRGIAGPSKLHALDSWKTGCKLYFSTESSIVQSLVLLVPNRTICIRPAWNHAPLVQLADCVKPYAGIAHPAL